MRNKIEGTLIKKMDIELFNHKLEALIKSLNEQEEENGTERRYKLGGGGNKFWITYKPHWPEAHALHWAGSSYKLVGYISSQEENLVIKYCFEREKNIHYYLAVMMLTISLIMAAVLLYRCYMQVFHGQFYKSVWYNTSCFIPIAFIIWGTWPMTYVNKAQKKRLLDLLNGVEKKTPIDSFSSAGGCVFFKNKGLGKEGVEKIGELYCDNFTVDEFYFVLKEECKKTQHKSLEAKEAFYCKCQKGHFWVRYRPDIWRDLQYICMTQMSAEIQQEKSGIRIKYYFEKEKMMFRRNLAGVIVFVIWGLLLILFALYNILFKHVMVQEQKELLIMGIFMQIIALFIGNALRNKPYQRERIIKFVKECINILKDRTVSS